MLGDELEQDMVSSSRSTMTSGGASIPKRMRPLLACTTVTRMDSLMRMLSPTFRERTSMIDPSMVSLAATGPSMTFLGCNCPLPVASRPLSLLFWVVILPRRGHWEVSGYLLEIRHDMREKRGALVRVIPEARRFVRKTLTKGAPTAIRERMGPG